MESVEPVTRTSSNLLTSAPTLDVESPTEMSTSENLPPRDYKFWLVFLGMGFATMITGLELSAVSTALPVIVDELKGSTTFVWVGSAYTLSATAFIPLSGGLAQIFGRKMVILAALLLTAIGSALCGAATSMNFLIAGRTVQGIGGGAITSITAIIISDLVPLRERGIFNGLIGIAWSVSSGAGPLIGGGLAQGGQWRWLFYLNIPICGVSALLMVLFLRVRTPPGTVSEKIRKVDWVGNALVIASTASCVIALTWSGIQHPWNSVPVLVPLILGLLGLIVFIAYEAKIAKHPLVPFIILTKLTSLSGYVQTFVMPVVMLGIIYYMPVYFQACKDLSPIGAGVDQLAVALVLAPVGIISGVSVNVTHKYRPQLWVSWVFVILGTGLLITLGADTLRGHAIGYLVICAIGLGILVTTTYFPVLAPLPVSQHALALSFFMFLRNFAQVWGVTIGGAVLQNELRKRMPAAFQAQFPEGTAVAYATIPLIPHLKDPLKSEVRAAFADSLKVVWEVMVGIAGLGLISCVGMKGLPLHTDVDKRWALENGKSDTKEGIQMNDS
ncbi:putative transporter C3H1.06c [Grifola frondosa]|uniref:Putative transporter C3H1.06c n=1 Tax=Grifola frondosa TaxID=5627 RepID=A0A1C7MJ79_GRIFR|nr:putative transporter C3H1.06c [Grifola frondosa]